MKLLQPDCPDQALSHSGSFEAWEETSVYVGKPVHVIWGLMSVCRLMSCCGITAVWALDELAPCSRKPLSLKPAEA